MSRRRRSSASHAVYEAAHREAFISVARAHFEIPAILSIYDQLALMIILDHATKFSRAASIIRAR
jgi:hypothetical protein